MKDAYSPPTTEDIAPATARPTRPRLLNQLTGLMLLVNTVTFIDMSIEGRVSLARSIVQTGLFYGVYWFFWKGANWARILVMLGSVISLIALATFNRASPGLQLIFLIDAPLSAFLLYWLWRRDVRSYFAGSHGLGNGPPSSPK